MAQQNQKVRVMLSYRSFSVLCFSSTHSLGITFCLDTINQSSTGVDGRQGLQWWWMSLRLVWVSASPARCLSLPPGSSTPTAPFLHHGVLAIEFRYAPPSELPSKRIFRKESVLAWRIRHRLDLSSIARGLGGAVMTRLARICRDLHECEESTRLLQWPFLLPADVCFFHIHESGTSDVTRCTSLATEAAWKRLHFQSVMLWPEKKCYGAS